MIAIANLPQAEVAEQQPDCCTALRGRKHLDVQANIMIADPTGCE